MIKLKVATLNFTGINNSPFEYHDGSQEKQALNTIFLENIKNMTGFKQESFKWDVSKIDTLLQKQRYSVAYRPDVGILNKKLVSDHEFNILWQYDYQRGIASVDTRQIKIDQSNIDNCRHFDYLMYRTLVQRVYGEDVDWERIKELDASKLRKYLQNWHSKPYLKNEDKMQKVYDYMQSNSLNVLFLQEAGFRDWTTIIDSNTYGFKKRGDSLILFKKKQFPEVKDQKQQDFFDKSFSEKLNFNKDSVYYLTNNQTLLVSAHLTSKSTNVEQAKQMFKVLEQIIKSYPDIKIILGTDANHLLKPSKDSSFRLFPRDQNVQTTVKKRTYMQLQFAKSQKMVSEAKDFILSNLPLLNKFGSIETIESKKPEENELLPNQKHPFDHYCVKVNVLMDQAFKKEQQRLIKKQKLLMRQQLSHSAVYATRNK